MRILLLLALAGLVASAALAPAYYAARPGAIDTDGLIDTDPAEQVRRGQAEKALGVTLTGYMEMGEADPEVVRKRFGTTFTLWAVAAGQPDLPQMVKEQVDVYLARRAELDPDGQLLQQVLREWLDLRLEHQTYFYGHAAVSIFLAARKDAKGRDRLMNYYIKEGPFYREFLPFARRVHPGWPAVEPVVTHYLEKGDLSARIESAATLLDYHSLFGEGEELLRRYRASLLRDLKEGALRIRRGQDRAFRARGLAVLSGLARIGEEGARMLEKMRDIDYDVHVELLRMARMGAGLVPFSRIRIGSTRWQLLDNVAQEYYFRHAIHRYLQLWRAAGRKQTEETRELRKIAEAALVSTNTRRQIYALMALAANDPEEARRLWPRFVKGGGVPSLFAASMKLPDDPVAILLPGLMSAGADYSALAAVTLLDLDGPLPLPRLAE